MIPLLIGGGVVLTTLALTGKAAPTGPASIPVVPLAPPVAPVAPPGGTAASRIPASPAMPGGFIDSLQKGAAKLPGIGPAAAVAIGLGAAQAKVVAATGGGTAAEVVSFLNPAGVIGHFSGKGAAFVAEKLGAPQPVEDALYRASFAAGTVGALAAPTLIASGPAAIVLAPTAAGFAATAAVAAVVAPPVFGAAVDAVQSLGNPLEAAKSTIGAIGSAVASTTSTPAKAIGSAVGGLKKLSPFKF